MSDTQTIERAEGAQVAPPSIIHDYPKDPRYRRSGMNPPQVGDVARCGWVKRFPPLPQYSNRERTCVVCVALMASR